MARRVDDKKTRDLVLVRAVLVDDSRLGLDRFDREVGSSNLLGDSSGLTTLDVGLTDLVEELGLSRVDVSENAADGRPKVILAPGSECLDVLLLAPAARLGLALLELACGLSLVLGRATLGGRHVVVRRIVRVVIRVVVRVIVRIIVRVLLLGRLLGGSSSLGLRGSGGLAVGGGSRNWLERGDRHQFRGNTARRGIKLTGRLGLLVLLAALVPVVIIVIRLGLSRWRYREFVVALLPVVFGLLFLLRLFDGGLWGLGLLDLDLLLLGRGTLLLVAVDDFLGLLGRSSVGLETLNLDTRGEERLQTGLGSGLLGLLLRGEETTLFLGEFALSLRKTFMSESDI